MPTIARWFIKAALVYFVAALVVGRLLALRDVLPLPPLCPAASVSMVSLLPGSTCFLSAV
ncbi:MAG: hypothetical protein HY784_15665 [Chloroflexi bacterium]|nr:hypothetical protein [Chloroflexota bacterium]